MIIVDKLCYSSRLRYVNPMEKCAYAMLTLIFCVVSRSIVLGAAVLVLNTFINVKAGGVSMIRYKNLMLIPFSFILLSTVAVIVNFSREPLDGFAISLGRWYITGSDEGILRGVRLISTAMSSISCLFVISLNTTMTDIIEVCRKLRFPELLIELMVLIYRYIFILLDIGYHSVTAANSRMGNITLRTGFKSFAGIIQVLLIRSVKKASAQYDAMEARCYDGKINVLKESKPVNVRNVVFIVFIELLMFAYTAYVILSDPGGIY